MKVLFVRNKFVGDYVKNDSLSFMTTVIVHSNDLSSQGGKWDGKAVRFLSFRTKLIRDEENV